MSLTNVWSLCLRREKAWRWVCGCSILPAVWYDDTFSGLLTHSASHRWRRLQTLWALSRLSWPRRFTVHSANPKISNLHRNVLRGVAKFEGRWLYFYCWWPYARCTGSLLTRSGNSFAVFAQSVINLQKLSLNNTWTTDGYLKRLALSKFLTEVGLSATKVSETGLRELLKFNTILKKINISKCENVDDGTVLLFSVSSTLGSYLFIYFCRLARI